MQPDLIIVDVILPGVSGLQVCRAAQGGPADRRASRSLVFSVLDVRERALAAGADAFLLKPLEQPALIDLVKTMLAARRRRPAGRRRESCDGAHRAAATTLST